MIGQTISHYRLEAELGRGTYGVVYRAVHQADEALKAAVKVVHPALVAEAGFVEALRTECRQLDRLDHPGIVRFRELVLADRLAAMVLELLEGGDLHGRGPLPPEQVAMLLERVLEALGHAHGRGVVHRDVKPSNVFWCSDGRVKLLDFGIARAATGTQAARTGQLHGTLEYMAPERFDGGGSAASDVYAVGLVAWELLAGARPTPPGSLASIMRWHLGVGAPDVRQARPDCPPGLAELVGRLVARDPGARPPDGYAALALLRSAQAGAFGPFWPTGTSAVPGTPGSGWPGAGPGSWPYAGSGSWPPGSGAPAGASWPPSGPPAHGSWSPSAPPPQTVLPHDRSSGGRVAPAHDDRAHGSPPPPTPMPPQTLVAPSPRGDAATDPTPIPSEPGTASAAQTAAAPRTTGAKDRPVQGAGSPEATRADARRRPGRYLGVGAAVLAGLALTAIAVTPLLRPDPETLPATWIARGDQALTTGALDQARAAAAEAEGLGGEPEAMAALRTRIQVEAERQQRVADEGRAEALLEEGRSALSAGRFRAAADKLQAASAVGVNERATEALSDALADARTRAWKQPQLLAKLPTRDTRISGVAWAPDSGTLAYATGLGDVWILDVDQGLAKRTLQERSSNHDVSSVVLSADGRVLVATGSTRTRIWSLPAGDVLADLPGSADYDALASMAPDGSEMAFLRLISGRSRIQIHRFDGSEDTLLDTGWAKVIGLAHSPTGQLAASVRIGERPWTSAVLLRTTAGDWRKLADLPHGGQGLTFSLDGRLLAAPRTLDDAGVWDVTTGAQVARIPVSLADTLSFSPDGRLLAIGDNMGVLYLYETATWTLHSQPERARGWIDQVAFSPDGTRLAVGSNERALRIYGIEALPEGTSGAP